MSWHTLGVLQLRESTEDGDLLVINVTPRLAEAIEAERDDLDRALDRETSEHEVREVAKRAKAGSRVLGRFEGIASAIANAERFAGEWLANEGAG